jgi:hypothetical protein
LPGGFGSCPEADQGKGWVCGMGSLLSEMEKPRSSAAFFVSYPLLSGYQVWAEKPPKFFEGIRVEVVWNEGEHFGTVREKLDKFSTFGGLAEKPRFGGRGQTPQFCVASIRFRSRSPAVSNRVRSSLSRFTRSAIVFGSWPASFLGLVIAMT